MRKFEQYQDMIARLFPELGDVESDERVLSRPVTFQVTDDCNLACTYCYQINKGKRRMSFETAKKFIDLLISGDKEMSTYINPTISPALIIEFIGGEPFLEIDLIDQICDYLEAQLAERMHPWATKHMFSICSNGVLYFDERVQKFLHKHRDNLSFSVTIDGNKKLHDSCRVFHNGQGSYDLAVAAAQDWMSRGYYMGSKITIAPGNLQYVYDAIMHMVDLGYEDINANCVYEEGWTQEHAVEFYKQLKRVADGFLEKDIVESTYLSLFEQDFFHPKEEDDLENWCGGNGVMLSCDPDGYLYPCIRYMESSLGTDQKPLRIGHVDVGMAQQQCERDCIHCLQCVNRRTQSTDECFYCPIAEGCSWCFKAGTKILTPAGEVNIEDLQIGDLVITEDGSTQKIKNLNKRYATDTILLMDSRGIKYYTTTEHPFLVCDDSGKHWVEAGQLKMRDQIAIFNGDPSEIAFIDDSVEPYEVYNLTVENNPTFIANGAIVHNCSAYNYQVFGTPDKRATYICEMHKARALANVYYWNSYYRLKGMDKRMKMHCPKEWALNIIPVEEYENLLKLSEEEKNYEIGS